MPSFKEILKNKRDYYGNSEAAIEFAANNYAIYKMIEDNKSILKLCELHGSERVCMVLRDKINEMEQIIKTVV